MKTKSILLACLAAFIMSACSNTVDAWEEALLYIDFGQESMPAEIAYEIDIKGPTSSKFMIQNRELSPIKVAVGTYDISVTAFLGTAKYAEGTKTVNVRAGINTVDISLSYVFDEQNEALLEIDFGQESMPDGLIYQIDIVGPTSLTFETDKSDIVRAKVAVGDYTISVTAFSDSIGGTVYAEGTVAAAVIGGRNKVSITLNLVGDMNMALLQIDLGRDMPDGLVYKIEIAGPTSTTNETTYTNYQVKVSLGTYNISVTAFLNTTKYAEGSVIATVMAGLNTVNITLNLVGTP